MLRDDAPHGVDDLIASAVSDGEIHVQAGVILGAVLRVGEHPCEFCGEDVGASDVLHPPVPFLRQRLGELGDDLDEVGELRESRFLRLSLESR